MVDQLREIEGQEGTRNVGVTIESGQENQEVQDTKTDAYAARASQPPPELDESEYKKLREEISRDFKDDRSLADNINEERKQVKESELGGDENFMFAANRFYEYNNNGNKFEGTPEELISDTLQGMSFIQDNTVGMAKTLASISSLSTEDALTMHYLVGKIGSVDEDNWEAVKRFGVSVGLDPTTYLGLGAPAFVGKAATRMAGITAIKAALKKVLTPAKIAAMEGAAYTGGFMYGEEKLSEKAGYDFDTGAVAAGTVIGAAGGAAIAKGIQAVPGMAKELKSYAGRRLDEFEKTPIGKMTTGVNNIVEDNKTPEVLSEAVAKAKPITMKDLEGKTVVPIVADLTKAGDAFTGIDSSKTNPVELMGGPNYPLLASSQEGGLVWANKGKHVSGKLKKAADEDGFVYGVVTSMKDDSHASNTTAVHAILETIKAYEKDGKLTKKNAHSMSVATRKKGREMGKAKNPDTQRIGKILTKIPDFKDIDKAMEYIYDMPFEARKVLVDHLRSAQIQSIEGVPNINKVLSAIREPEYAGGNWGDAQMVIKIDTNDVVQLGKNGFKNHPSYEYGIQGEVVGKLERPINYKQMFPDFIKSRRDAGKDTKGDPRAFDLSSPSQKITPEMVNSMPSTAYKSIKSPRQAKMFVDAKKGNWKTSDTTVKDGGISTTDFATALIDSDASETLSKYSASELTKQVKSGDTKLYQLGDSKAFFGLKKNTNYENDYGFKSDELTGKETSLISVVNNEQNSPKTGALLVAKAVEDGAEVLDAYALPLTNKPGGLLPEYYSKFGFEEVGRVPFDPQYSTKQELKDIIHYWKSQGWDESKGYPSVAIMKWKGQPNERSGFTDRLLSGSSELFTKGSSGLDGVGVPRPITNGGSKVKGNKSGASGSDAVYGKEPRRGGTNDVSAVSGEIDNLSEIELKNLGL